MRLAEISDRVLDWYDLSRVEARREARAGQLWAAGRYRLAVAPTAEAAAWMLGAEAWMLGAEVERVACSTLSDGTLWDLSRRVREAQALSRRLGRVERSEWDPEAGVLHVVLR